MHELSIATAILDEVVDVAEREHAVRVRSVRLKVGELSSVVNDALRFAWDIAVEGTIAGGSRLDIERVPVRVFCERCAQEREPLSTSHLVCAACGEPAPKIIKGLELLVLGMEVDDADTRGGSAASDPEKEFDVSARDS